MPNLKAEQEQREAEEAVRKEVDAILPQNVRELSTTDHLLRWGRENETAAVRRELKLRAYERAVEDFKGSKFINSDSRWKNGYNKAVEQFEEILSKHLEAIP